MKSFGCALLLVLVLQFPSHAQHFEILRGNALLQRGGRLFNVYRGTKLVEGDRLFARSTVIFVGDYKAFTAIFREGMLEFLQLSRDKNGCIQNVIGFRGSVSFSSRPRLCRGGFVTALSLASGASYAINSAVDLFDSKDSSFLAVQYGRVDASNAGKTLRVTTGLGNVTMLGQPPGPAIALDNDLALRDLKIRRTALGLEITANINPLNSLRIQGVDVSTEYGAVKALLDLPMSGNSLNFEVRNSAGKARVYSLPRK
jgi:hypothetical protein